LSTPITSIPGIGASTAAILEKHGYQSAEAIAATTPEKLGNVPGFGERRSASVIEAARRATTPTGAPKPEPTAKTAPKPEASPAAEQTTSKSPATPAPAATQEPEHNKTELNAPTKKVAINPEPEQHQPGEAKVSEPRATASESTDKPTADKKKKKEKTKGKKDKKKAKDKKDEGKNDKKAKKDKKGKKTKKSGKGK
jgi:hypothetical protein